MKQKGSRLETWILFAYTLLKIAIITQRW